MIKLFLTIDPNAFQIGSFQIKWYAIIIAFGALIGYLLFKRQSKPLNITEDDQLDIMFWAIIMGLLGARVYYVLFKLPYYIQTPLEIFNVRGGGMAIYGGVIAGIITLYIMSKQKKIPFISVLDAAAPGLLLAQAIGRWGNFMNQEAHGEEVSRQFLESIWLPDWMIEQMNIQGQYYHPTFLYESVWNIIGVGIMLLYHYIKGRTLNGTSVAIYLIWYGIGRALIEGMRTDSLYIGSFRVSQVLSIGMVLLGIGLFMTVVKPRFNHK